MNASRWLHYVLIFLLSLAMLTGCGSSDGGNDNGVSPVVTQNGEDDNVTDLSASGGEQSDTLVEELSSPDIVKTKGYLIDSAVEGVNYICADGTRGLTTAKGMFVCVEAPVTFKIGNLTLGSIAFYEADSNISIQEILGLAKENFSDDTLKLLARFLQSLDDDGDIEKRITITKEIREQITEVQDFKSISESEVKALLQGLGKNFVSECGALKHLGDVSVNCDGDGGYVVTSAPVDNGSVAPITNNQAKVKVSLEKVELPSENKYFIATSKSISKFEEDSDVVVDIEKKEQELISLTDEFGNPFLIARKLKGQSNVDISLDSTAETFVLMRKRFFGRTIKDDNLLSERIRENENFEKLKKELVRRMKISPCPLNSECSPVASYIADKVANSLDLTDVINEEK